MTNMHAVTIESAEQKDYASWLPLWINYQTFYRTIISDEVTKLTWERFFTPSEPVYCAVAKYDGKIVGLVHYLFHRSTWAESNYCYLEDLFVSEDVRGQHIGKQLIEYVQQQAKKNHASRLYWHTHETNLRGQRLYDWVAKKSGMIEYRM
ncbi:GNAT family N-acetyltransferase [Citrobacter freundii]|uniref:GNAT family N-acetyltransferase n=1 Tax=Citrobacter freundii complex TaxID=1344959 RepID=UPI00065202BE|nr:MULTISPECIES: GNAT family N-acetyltransferase [Citrobacter freundii complex]EKU6816727.1 GNAT family N-acetyltransferase [Citrobacter freundii]MBE0074635.1 GNAT family N-acetyltransferase [Citrobacter freundii]MDE9685355.1 GNAT family N-acetyltransferase [Citrobacter freundii]MEA8838836.1 GNAT family N-acetyltransferase [Citrobacter freundii]MEA8848406.1 GNAT family N-acetyltransferase [Citrobacter freundii]